MSDSDCPLDCDRWWGDLQPYPDIGGTGVRTYLMISDSEHEVDSCQVIIGFLGTAWFVVVLVVLYYFSGSQSTNDPFATPPKTGILKQPDPDPERVWVPNYVDQLVLRMSGRLGKVLSGGLKNTKLYIWLAERPRWEHAFIKVPYPVRPSPRMT